MGWVTDKGTSGVKKFEKGGKTSNPYKEMVEKHKESEAKRLPKETAIVQTVGDMIDPTPAKMKEVLETAKDFYTDKAKDVSLKDVANVVSKAVPGASLVKKAATKVAKALKDKKKKDKKKKNKNKTANI